MDTSKRAAEQDRIETLFGEVIALAPPEREAVLQARAQQEPGVVEEVRSLVAAHEAAPGFFTRVGRHLSEAMNLALDRSEAAVPERVGPYRVLRPIGRGGMGTVFLAERSDGHFQQEVALKLLQPSQQAQAALQRFLSERQILASLSHPHIARLYDGGVTADGQPFFAMEYVGGVPLTTYCVEQALPVAERLRLIQQACAAVHCAHQNLIVHRDLKPSNILVTPEGQLKLLDFGIAKSLTPDVDPQAPALTRDGPLPMTPEYASPEQLKGERIGTASDVYQLGALLYEVLAGQRPYGAQATTRYELERRIIEDEPVKPSQAARGSEGLAAAVPRRAWPDLDAIVLRAMRKGPANRYASAAALHADLQRFLDGRPVRAREGTLQYRLGKMVRKHQLAVALSAVAVLLLLAVAVLSVRFAVVTQRQAEQVALERDKATQMVSFLVDLFQVADPAGSAGADLTAEQLLDRGATRIESELREQPETRAMLMNVIGRIYRQLGLYQQSEQLLDLALLERQQVLGRDHADVAETLQELGQLRFAQADYAEAESLLTTTLALQQQQLGDASPDIARTMSSLGQVRQSRGDYDGAEALFAEALSLREQHFGAKHADVAASLNDLASVYRNQGDYQTAEHYYRDALAMYVDLVGREHLWVARTLNNLASVLQNQGRYREAEGPARQALGLYRQLFGAEHPEVATSQSNLAFILQRQGAYAEARDLYRQALAMRRTMLGATHPHVGHSLLNLAGLHQEEGAYRQAEPLMQEALGIYRTTYGDVHATVAQAYTSLGWLMHNLGDTDAAEPHFREAVRVRSELYGAAHPQVAKSQSYLASLLLAQGQLQEALARYNEAVQVLDGAVHALHPDRALALTGLAEVLIAQHRPEQAEPLLREALAIRLSAFGAAHWQTAETQSALGYCLYSLGYREDAERLLRVASRTLDAQRGPKNPAAQTAAQRLTEVLQASPVRPAGER